jgi:hypothetical protein
MFGNFFFYPVQLFQFILYSLQDVLFPAHAPDFAQLYHPFQKFNTKTGKACQRGE